LAWSRTAVGLLANGALLIVGRDRRAGAGVVAALAGAALLLALAVALAASRRSRELRRQLRPIPLAVQHRVTALGFGVAAFALLTGLSLLR
jgi:lysylphosphatidylglycerol synthetase-like protein (DUF2156 family)